MDLAREYRHADYVGVKKLAEQEDLIFPDADDLGGTGMVVEHGGVIIGFAWALTSPDSRVCHIDYFVVDKAFRGKHTVGPALMTGLFVKLEAMGMKIFMGSLRKSNEFSIPLARIYQKVGVKLSDELYFVSGNVADVLSGLKERYDEHNRIKD